MNDYTTNDAKNTDDSNDQPIIGLPGDERDVLISRVIDGIATSHDWTIFRALAAHDPSIWTELADTQSIQETMCTHVDHFVSIADHIELPGGLIDDQPMRTRLDIISKWGGWAAAAAILVVWFLGNPSLQSSNEITPITAGFGGSNILLDQAQPDQAFDQYLASGQSSGQVVGEMPEHIVIETRPMPDGTIEVLYLRQIIERQIIDHAYREMRDETGNVFPVPVKLSPRTTNSF
ncbi:hypothetical protein COB72_07060 [bacterium]|nr:MAG: hypothetical protein COB72_07060 [bacterium]